MNDILDNVSTLTSINKKALEKLSNVAIYCLNDAVEESRISGEEITEADIGIGKLLIKFDGEQVKYKFIPSAKLEESITDTIVHKSNILEIAIENSLKDKVLNTYKDLI